jgi:hypothetical protein
MARNLRRPFVIVAVLLGIAGIVIAGFVFAGTSSAPRTSNGTLVSVCRVQTAHWWETTGQTETSAVENDLGNISADATADNAPQLQSDASQLETDATTAVTSPQLPACADPTGSWLKGMTDYSIAGTEAAQGNYTQASSTLSAGTRFINVVTAELHANGVAVHN